MSKKEYTGYAPPFEITDEISNLSISIAEIVGHLSAATDNMPAPMLRKQNRIKTIQSTLAIENNSLSVEQVTAILNGKRILGAPNEIQEVKNAIDAYNLLFELNPYKEDDLFKAHRMMMSDLVSENGRYRNGGVGVFDGERCIHLAPPAQRVPGLMNELFGWLKHAPDHLLIRSCVFHYELEFIHPFSDGNGRMGRLWQSLILGRLNPVFEHLPIENLVYSNQQQYYDAISMSTRQADSGPFIDYMLREILNALKKYQSTSSDSEVPNKVPDKIRRLYPELSDMTWVVLSHIIENPYSTSARIGNIVGISDRMVRKHIALLRKSGLIRRQGSNKTGHWEILT